MAYSDGALAYKNAYELNCISLTGGIAGSVPGGGISVLSLLQGLSFGGFDGAGDFDPDNAFANFFPIAGSTLVTTSTVSTPSPT